jgi:7-cyano-7-deazaguanine synthase
MRPEHKALCILSGGLDSGVCLGIAKSQHQEVFTIFFNYGQKTYAKEKECVEKLVKFYDIKNHTEIDITWLKSFGVSALFDRKVQLTKENFVLEYVPFRNSIFLSIATALAESKKIQDIYIGSTGGDHICPDNSPSYLKAYQKVIKEGTLLIKDITIAAPLLKTDKTGAVKMGTKLGVPFQYTWSCHNAEKKACKTCSNCMARLEAFKENHLSDPIQYV